MKIYSIPSSQRGSETVLNIIPEDDNEVSLLIERRAQIYIRINRTRLREVLDDLDVNYPPRKIQSTGDIVTRALRKLGEARRKEELVGDSNA